MLSENIREFRKKSNMSQDDLAEKLGVSRQSISLWETGQTQPTIDNIIALAKIFSISTDTLLGNSDGTVLPQEAAPQKKSPDKKRLVALILMAVALVIVIAVLVTSCGSPNPGDGNKPQGTVSTPSTTVPTQEPFDLFAYCKDFAIQKGVLNGDYSIYQQPSTKYGGFEGKYFSIAYWASYDKVELCLHCPLSETQSINFSLIMRGGFDGTYEYTSSKYYRDTGESFRFATGNIDPAVFSDHCPLNFSSYEGSIDGQTEFLEESRVGICDLIRCLKQFVKVENMECDFSDFGFVNF